MPDLKRLGEDYLLTWPEYQIIMTFHGVYEDKTGVHAECTVASTGALGSLLWERVNLTSGTTRQQASKRLTERYGGTGAPPWDDMMLQAAHLVVAAFRDGEPFIKVGQREVREAPRYRIDGMVPESQVTVLFGDGGTGKSYLALAMALAVYGGGDFLGRPATVGQVLYLDWETSADEIDQRIKALTLFDPVTPSIGYRRMIRPLADEASRIRQEVDREGYQFVVVDSIGAAVGADPNNAQDVIRCFGAMRALGTTCLAIDHVAKADSEGKPYGSAYKYNYARSAWETRKEQLADENTITVALLHRKANNGRLQQPLGIRIEFSGEDEQSAVAVSPTDLRQTGLVATLGVPNRILDELSRGMLTAEALAERLPDINHNTLKVTLSRMFKRGELINAHGQWGKAAKGV